jgi:hypothetical protein
MQIDIAREKLEKHEFKYVIWNTKFRICCFL